MARLVLITGGSRGIGRGLVTAFARAGDDVLLTATSADRAVAAAAEVTAELAATPHPGRVRGCGLLAGEPASAAELLATVQNTEAELGSQLAVVINNAGAIESSEGPLWEAAADSLRQVVTTNLLGPALVIHALAKHLMSVAATRGEPSRIIDLNSGSGAQGTPAYGMYSASKLGLFRIADSVAHYGHDQGLRIFEMAPGVVRTDMTEAMPVHDQRHADDWTAQSEVNELALAIAAGSLDAYSGRYLRAGYDTPQSLAAHAGQLTAQDRRLVLNMEFDA